MSLILNSPSYERNDTESPAIVHEHIVHRTHPSSGHFSTSSVETGVSVVFGFDRVIASTSVIELAPMQGLVLPGTKNRKPVPRPLPLFAFMLYAVIPRRDYSRGASISRLMATRNQYRRLQFIHLYKSTSELLWYHLCCRNYVVETWPQPVIVTIPIQHRIIGGGRSNVTWSSAELASFAGSDDLPAAMIYTMTEYIEKSKTRANDVPGILEINVPLNALAKKLPIRTLVEVCSFHGVRVSRSHDTRDSIRSRVNDHTCESCDKFVCIFEPVSYRSSNEATVDVFDHGKSNVVWKTNELDGYTGWTGVSPFEAYRMTGYIEKRFRTHEKYRDSILLDVPLKDLAHRLSLKSLVGICACHGININKGILTLIF